MKIKGKEFVEWTESDLRFTGWEDECIIIDRSENHYLIPEQRYDELMKIKNKPIPTQQGVCGSAGATGIGGYKKLI